MVKKKVKKKNKKQEAEEEKLSLEAELGLAGNGKDGGNTTGDGGGTAEDKGSTTKNGESKVKKGASTTKDGEGVAKKGEGKKNGGWMVLLIMGVVSTIAGVACFLVGMFGVETREVFLEFPRIPSLAGATSATYSALTGEVLSDPSAITAPVFCMQTPNGTDGGRPQAGLNQAGVIFEAIAEAGITRFAAIYQGADAGVIGPIRSLRIYYLDWDTPFNCAIVHAGGAPDALAAVRNGRYYDMDEGYTYMYRGTVVARRWNNLFTTAGDLTAFARDYGYDKAEIRGFKRMTPEESARSRVDGGAVRKLVITEAADGNTSEVEVKASRIGLRLGGYANFNVEYAYDAEQNRYLRSYESGVAHEVYDCPSGDIGRVNPEEACELVQMAPEVVVAMVVQEGKAEDNYHEDIQTIGSGEAYIFQNGDVLEGKWVKQSREDQIKFVDKSGSEILLAPGQTFVTAVPGYGGVEFE